MKPTPNITNVQMQQVKEVVKEHLNNHKFFDIQDESLLCLNADKEKERAANKKIRDEKKKELDELRKKENVNLLI